MQRVTKNHLKITQHREELSASNMFDGLICTLCEGLGLMRQIRLRARRLTPTA